MKLHNTIPLPDLPKEHCLKQIPHIAIIFLPNWHENFLDLASANKLGTYVLKVEYRFQWDLHDLLYHQWAEASEGGQMSLGLSTYPTQPPVNRKEAGCQTGLQHASLHWSSGVSHQLSLVCKWNYHYCYVWAERSARLELEGYNQVASLFVSGASASGTLWEHSVCGNKGDTWWRGRGRYPRRTRWFQGSLEVLRK